ncbi:MAG TPA: FtsQ-type POTRA domain-containing protein [Vicinamibacteria bacterium]|nr:FtsQ-type POTRA domain-containing protein [Vicinamibacteria bacterium]
MTERRRRDPRQKTLLLPAVDLPIPDVEDPPFLRPARRTRVRRARRGWLGRTVIALEMVAGLVAVVFVLWTAYSQVMGNRHLRVANVEVRGSHFLSEGEVRELLGPAVGENILSLDIDELKARLRASPWVADATVSRTLPDTLRVEVHERAPLALAEVERLYLMDQDGVLIDMYGPRTAGFDLPIVRGLGKVDVEARRERAQRAGALLADLADLGSEVSEVEASGDLRVVLRGDGEVVRLGAPPYRPRLLTFLALRKELTERCPDAEYFDLRFRDRIYAKQPPNKVAPVELPPGLPAPTPPPVVPAMGPPAPPPSPLIAATQVG